METGIKRIAIFTHTTIEFIQLDQIVRFEGLQNYTRVFLTSEEMLVSTEGIGFYKSNLKNQCFFSCHKSHCVNEAHVVRFHKEGHLEMSDTSTVPLSRRKREAFYTLVEERYRINLSD